MHRSFALTLAALAAIFPMQSATAFNPQTGPATSAITWLHSQQATDGMVAKDATRTEETVWGLVANGESVASFTSAGKTPIDALRSNIASEEKTAGNIGNLLLAVSAAGINPAEFAGRNLLQDLQCTYDASTGRYNDQLFNDATAILALPPGTAPKKATDYLLSQQQANGGWEFQSGFGSDTNTTAIVVMALVAANALASTAEDRALAYFKLHQKPSGGFEYSDPFSPPGDSDPNSDALVIEALLAAGQDPTGSTWTIADKNAVTDLLSFQFENGGFGYNRPGSSASAVPDAASTAQALPALASKFLPVKPTTGLLPASCPAAAASSRSPSGPPTSRLAQTGSAPIGPLAGGLALALAGWRMRRRSVDA
jgi:hypothetical protein